CIAQLEFPRYGGSIPGNPKHAEKQFDCAAHRRFRGTEGDPFCCAVCAGTRKYRPRVLHLQRRAVPVPGRELETVLRQCCLFADRFHEHLYPIRPEWLGIRTSSDKPDLYSAFHNECLSPRCNQRLLRRGEPVALILNAGFKVCRGSAPRKR